MILNIFIYAVIHSILFVLLFKFYQYIIKAKYDEKQRKKAEKTKMEFYNRIDITHFKEQEIYNTSSN